MRWATLGPGVGAVFGPIPRKTQGPFLETAREELNLPTSRKPRYLLGALLASPGITSGHRWDGCGNNLGRNGKCIEFHWQWTKWHHPCRIYISRCLASTREGSRFDGAPRFQLQACPLWERLFRCASPISAGGPLGRMELSRPWQLPW